MDIHDSIEAAIRTYQKGLDTQSPFVLEHERHAPLIPDKLTEDTVDGWFIYRNGRGAYLRMTHIRKFTAVTSRPVAVTAQVWSKDNGWIHVAGEVVPFRDNDLPKDSAEHLARIAAQLFRLSCNFADLQVHR